MQTILDKIIEHKRLEIERTKRKIRYSDFENYTFFNHSCYSLKNRLETSHFGIIAELKRKSPSAGDIMPNLDIKKQAKVYVNSGVSGISCLTDHRFFGGSLQDLLDLRTQVTIPILRKEFIIDEFQIFESKAHGADVILLIAEILDREQILHYTIIAQSLGMEVIVECNSKGSLDKITDFSVIVGINNRNLHLQTCDLTTSRDLHPFIPSGVITISESGIKNRNQLIQLKQFGFNGALIGESILKSDQSNFLSSLTQLNESICL